MHQNNVYAQQQPIGRRFLPLLLIASLLLSACTVNVYMTDPSGEIAKLAVEGTAPAVTHTDEHAGEHADDHATSASGRGGRLLVADAESGQLQLLDLGTGTVIADYAIGGPAALYTTESGRFAGVVEGAANQVHFVDSGLWVEEHGDHTHNRTDEPQLLPFSLDGVALQTQNPVHFVAHHGVVTVHFDGDGATGIDAKNIIVDEAALLGENPPLREFVTAPQHGVSIVTADGHTILSVPNAVLTDTLPTGFAIYDTNQQMVQEFNDLTDPAASCVGMHGEALVGEHYLFGCHQDDGGVLVITQHDDASFTSKKLTYPDARRTSVLVSHPDRDIAVGQYGVYPDYNGLVRIDPALDAIPAEAVVELPANQCGFAFERAQGDQLVVLTEDGTLHLFNPTDWRLLGSLQVTEPFACFGDAPAPSLAVGAHVAYVSLPASGEILEVDLATIQVTRTFAVAGQPSSLALFGWYGALRGAASAITATTIPATRLIVADPTAGGLYVYSVPDWTPVAEFPDLTLADHPGYIVLTDGRVLFTTPDNELIVLDVTSAAPSVVGRVTLPGTAIHLAVDPNQAFAVISTLHDDEAGTGEDTLTQVDLTSFALSKIALTTGEPGVLVGEGVVLHRDGDAVGRLEAFSVDSFATGNTTASSYVDIGAYGHGEAIVNGHAYIATDDGLDIVQIAGDQLAHEAVLPGNTAGREGGRGYYMRADAHGNLWSYLRIVANPEADASWLNWQDWANDGYLIDTKAETVQRFELGAGLVYRQALSSNYALYSRIHPDGDEAILVDADPNSATFAQILARIPLPATSDAPVAGVDPWTSTGQRITGITADGAWGFVTGGGDGVVHVIDTVAQTIVGQIDVPSPLTGGGYLLLVQPGQPVVDTVGR